MKKLKTRPVSVREETFALAACTCSCACGCEGTCNCPVAPTHQQGLNAQSTLSPLHNGVYNTTQESAKKHEIYLFSAFS